MKQTLNKLSLQVITILIKTEETYKGEDGLAVAVITKIKKVKIFYTERESEVILTKKMTQ